MGTLHHMTPKEIRFPNGVPFEVGDQYNGPIRGRWFYRSIHDGAVLGPFFTQDEAETAMIDEPPPKEYA